MGTSIKVGGVWKPVTTHIKQAGVWKAVQTYLRKDGEWKPLEGGDPTLALDLDFTSGVLDPRVTFSRATSATMYDSTGMLTYAPHNLAQYSQDSSGWSASGSPSFTTGIDDPFGGNNAVRVTFTTLSQSTGAIVPAQPGGTLLVSFWARYPSSGAYPGSLLLRDGGLAGQARFIEFAPTTSWQRFACSFPSLPAGAVVFEAGPQWDSDPSTGVVEFFGWQVEITGSSTPSSYKPTGSSAYYGPRFDHDPVTLLPRGLLIEEQRTNLEPRSSISGASGVWTINGAATATANSQTAPDGTTAAVRLAASNTASDIRALRMPGFSVANGPIAVSVFMKKNGPFNGYIQINSFGGASVAYFDLTAGTAVVGADLVAGYTNKSASIEAMANGWYRCKFTLTTPDGGSFLQHYGICGAFDTSGDDRATVGVVGQGVDLWGAQVEESAVFATSYIPTTTAAVTRAADSASMTGTNFSSWFNQPTGTWFIDYRVGGIRPGGANNFMYIQDASANDDYIVGINSSGDLGVAVFDNGSLQATSYGSFPPVAAVGRYKAAFAYAVNDFASTYNGAAVVTDTSGTVPTPDRLTIGSYSSGFEYCNGHVVNLRFYNVRKTNAELQALTS